MRRPNAQVLQSALDHWRLSAPAEFVAQSGNAVYRVGDVFVRFTDPTDYRTLQDNRAECEFVRYLAQRSVPVCAPLPARDGRSVIAVGVFWVSAFQRAPGRIVPRADWDVELAGEWGRALGRLHAAAVGFRPSMKRWDWDRETWFASADALFPKWDRHSRAELATVFSYLYGLPMSELTFGMVHGDFAPQNFGYRAPIAGDTSPPPSVVAFDFGNCCQHWFVRDVAVSLSTLRTVADRRALKARLLEGYCTEFDLPDTFERDLPWFLRLRRLTVYLSRLWRFGPDPTEGELETLALLRASVENREVW